MRVPCLPGAAVFIGGPVLSRGCRPGGGGYYEGVGSMKGGVLEGGVVKKPPPLRRLTSGQYASYWNAFLLPPAKKLGQGNVFTPVCHSVHRGSLSHTPGQAPACAVHAGIRSISGRYASYWIAFLYFKMWPEK